MPTYEYECQACQHRFDHFQSMTSRRLRTCPECKEKKLVRLVGSGAGVIFKGSGFYETDYKRSGSAGKPSSESGPSEGAAASEDSGKSSGKGSSSGNGASGGGASGGGASEKTSETKQGSESGKGGKSK